MADDRAAAGNAGAIRLTDTARRFRERLTSERTSELLPVGQLNAAGRLMSIDGEPVALTLTAVRSAVLALDDARESLEHGDPDLVEALTFARGQLGFAERMLLTTFLVPADAAAVSAGRWVSPPDPPIITGAARLETPVGSDDDAVYGLTPGLRGILRASPAPSRPSATPHANPAPPRSSCRASERSPSRPPTSSGRLTW